MKVKGKRTQGVHTAVIPGSFDPPTLGHLDIIRRASSLFEEVIVAVANNTSKSPIFTADERVKLLTESVADLRRVRVESFQGLLLDYVHSKKDSHLVILRGIRSNTDFEYELEIAQANKALDSKLETIFMVTDQMFSFVRSSIIKELVLLGGPVSKMVPANVEKALQKKN